MAGDENDDLRRAEQLVLEARRIVQQQKGRIIRLRAGGAEADYCQGSDVRYDEAVLIEKTHG